jgi:tetratricopeptide (TPR) repeat protein
VLVKLKRYEEALQSYDQALKLNPDDNQAWHNRGNVLTINLKRYEEALQSYDKALESNPDDDQAWYNQACIYSQQDNIDLAVKHLAQAIRLNPKDRGMAKTDSDFDNIREKPNFKALIDD